jgi:hypothetical protein
LIIVYVAVSCFFLRAFCINHVMVKVGMISIPGSNSSRKAKPPPKNPFTPPNVLMYIKPEMGAHKRSKNSPKKGTANEAYPSRSINMQNDRDGKGFCLAGWNFVFFLKNSFFNMIGAAVFSATVIMTKQGHKPLYGIFL